MEKLYHVSNVEGLSVLEPKVSTHGKPYVYATKNLALSLLFGSDKGKGDLDGIYGESKIDGKPYFYEAYEGAFKRRFEDCSCYVYEVDPTTFMQGKTSFKAEVVSEKPVKVLNCTKVDDLYKKLQELIENKEMHFIEYNLDENYQNIITQHLTYRIKTFGILDRPNSDSFKFCMEKFPKIMEEFIKKENSQI